MWQELIIPASDLDEVKQFEGHSDQLGYYLKTQQWDEDQRPNLAILGIPEGRGSRHEGVANGTRSMREQLYTLVNFPAEMTIVDLGDVRQGHELKDTYAAVKMVVEELTTYAINLLILGGSQELTVPLLEGIHKDEEKVIIVDDRVDNSIHEDCPADESFINHLPVTTSATIIAGQSYFISQQEYDIVAEGFNGEIQTLGTIRNDFKELEPLLRTTDLVSFDFGSMKASEAPGQYRVSPNGLTGEEACQIAWYSGMSTRPAIFGIFGFDSMCDNQSIGGMMAAQIGWYFIYGTSKRIDEAPIDEATDFEHYHIDVEGLEEPISFLRHPVSHRWWMEVPNEDCSYFPVRIPCSKKDYTKARDNEIPDRWWHYFNRL